MLRFVVLGLLVVLALWAGRMARRALYTDPRVRSAAMRTGATPLLNSGESRTAKARPSIEPGPARAQQPSAATRAAVRSVDSWHQELEQIRGQRDRDRFLKSLARLPADASGRIVRALYPAARDGWHRQILLDFLFEEALHRQALEILVEFARSEAGPARLGALRALRRISFIDFSVKPGEFVVWAERFRNMPQEDVWRRCALEFVTRLRDMTLEACRAELRGSTLVAGVSSGAQEALRDGGLAEIMLRWIRSDSLTQSELSVAHAWIRKVDPDKGLLRREYMPVIENADRYTCREVYFACAALGRRCNLWAIESLIVAYARTQSRWKKWYLSNALDKIVGEPWLAWARRHREALGSEIRTLSLPERHPWDECR